MMENSKDDMKEEKAGLSKEITALKEKLKEANNVSGGIVTFEILIIIVHGNLS